MTRQVSLMHYDLELLKDIKLFKILNWTGKQIISKILESIITLLSALLPPPCSSASTFIQQQKVLNLSLNLSGCEQINQPGLKNRMFYCTSIKFSFAASVAICLKDLSYINHNVHAQMWCCKNPSTSTLLMPKRIEEFKITFVQS